MTNKGLRFKSFPIFLLSVGYVGFIPWAPGTWGSAVAMVLPFVFSVLGVKLLPQIILLILLTLAASYLAQKVQKECELHDPGWIVFDEVLGMWLGSFFLPELSLHWVLLLFVFFRFFDILKIWPVNVIDQKLTHGLGVMLDDLLAGLYAGVSLVVTAKILEYFKIFI